MQSLWLDCHEGLFPLMLTTLVTLRSLNPLDKPHSTLSHLCPVSSHLIEFIIEWAMVFFDGIFSLGIVGYGQGQSSLITFIFVTSVQNVNMEYYCISSVQHNLSYTWNKETKRKNAVILLLLNCFSIHTKLQVLIWWFKNSLFENDLCQFGVSFLTPYYPKHYS